jgi:hypothetical protein
MPWAEKQAGRAVFLRTTATIAALVLNKRRTLE